MSQRKGNVITFFFLRGQKEDPAVSLIAKSITFFLRRKRGVPFHALILSFCADRKKVCKDKQDARGKGVKRRVTRSVSLIHRKEPPPRYYRALLRIGQAAR